MILKKINSFFKIFGIDFMQLVVATINLPRYLLNIARYSQLNKENKFNIKVSFLRPILHERNLPAGYLSLHYFHQDIWAAKKILNRRPSIHYDIGSRIDGFISHLLVFMPVTVLDIRPLQNKIPNLNFIQCDATDLAGIESNSIDSLSSLHAIEHFGLGRYGDHLDPSGYSKVLKAMQRVLKPGGCLYIGVPIGKERVEFNSQRVFDPSTIVEKLDELTLKSFSVVDEKGELIQNTDIAKFSNCSLCCGLFEFIKS